MGSLIFPDPGEVSGGEKMSKTGEKKIPAKKTKEREEEPLGTRFLKVQFQTVGVLLASDW